MPTILLSFMHTFRNPTYSVYDLLFRTYVSFATRQLMGQNRSALPFKASVKAFATAAQEFDTYFCSPPWVFESSSLQRITSEQNQKNIKKYKDTNH